MLLLAPGCWLLAPAAAAAGTVAAAAGAVAATAAAAGAYISLYKNTNNFVSVTGGSPSLNRPCKNASNMHILSPPAHPLILLSFSYHH